MLCQNSHPEGIFNYIDVYRSDYSAFMTQFIVERALHLIASKGGGKLNGDALVE